MIETSRLRSLNEIGIEPFVFPTKSYALYISTFYLSLIGLSVGYVMSLTSFSFNSLYQALELFSYLLFIFSLTKLIKIDFEISYFRMIVFIYFIWQVLILVRGDYSTFDYFELKQFIFDLNYGGALYFIPLLVFINFNMFLIKRLFDTAVILSLIYFVFFFLNFGVLFDSDLSNLISQGAAETYFKYLAIPVGILALNFNLLNDKVKPLILIVLLMVFVVAIFRARRGMIFMAAMITFFGGLNYFITSERKFSILFYLTYGLIGVFLFFFYSIGEDIGENFFFKNVASRGLEDTRGYVENCFFNDMSSYDWFFGKGFNGGYKCPGIDENIFEGGIRRVIETDFLQLIMNGGIVNIFLLLAIILPAIILGLFYSNNNLVKTLAIWILLWLLFLYPANVYSFSLFHISIWLSAGICYTAPIRKLPNSFVKKYFLSEFIIKPELKDNNNA
ncbi:hypothetical protein [Algoriphagus sp.]|uniref:hypothetical protein n=1 Tax=Algoriphagus sp. TaxID=1872435 RepID=UPI0025FC3A11|nr:hypothetical protein [Algoriphagus sp.]